MKPPKKEPRINMGDAACAAGRHIWIVAKVPQKKGPPIPMQICGRCETPRSA